jgi:predicted MPP superfamily phosphohydrolase
MFGTILISVCSLMHFYVFWRAASVPFVNRHVPLNLLIVTGVLLWAIFFIGRLFHHGADNKSIHMIDAAGFKLLRNRWVEVRPGFILAGVDDLTAKYRAGRDGDFISQALAGRPPGVTILLSHTPWQANRAASAGASLMLSGHTHGGQIWPFGYLTRRTYPLLGGRYEVSGMPVIVCRGTGTWGPRMRLWRPGEILRVTFREK